MKTEQETNLFSQLVRAGFDPIRDMIEYGDLAESLSAQDITMITQAIEGGLNNWVQFIKMAKSKDTNAKTS
jgi:hypothetical protein